MWADTLLANERTLFLRLLLWSAMSVLAGTALMAGLRMRGQRSELLLRFGQNTVGWGVAEALVALVGIGRLAPRDLSSATRLDRILWLNIGLDVGYLLVGVAIIAAGWRAGRRLGLVGTGLAAIVQGSALALLDLLLAAQVSR